MFRWRRNRAALAFAFERLKNDPRRRELAERVQAAAAARCDCPCHDVIQPGLVPCPSCRPSGRGYDMTPDHSSRSVRPEEGSDG